MAFHFNDLVRQGLVAVKSRRFGMWKKRWIVLRRYSSAGPPRIEEFTELQTFNRLTDSSSTRPTHVWPLIDVVGVTQGNSRPNPRKTKVTIYFGNRSVEQFKFSTNSTQEAEHWRHDIEEVSSMIYAEMRISDNAASGFPTTVQSECFRVFLQPSPLLSCSGECHMQVTSSQVTVTDLFNDSRVVTWDIDTIRRFGSDQQQLYIETGRSSSTGEGYFEFRSFESQKIERHLNAVTFALSTAVHVMETDVNRGGPPMVPSRPSQHRLQRQRRLYQSTETEGCYMQHARSEPGSSAGLVPFSDSPEAYRRPSAPTPYPPPARTRSPPAVTHRTDFFPLYLAACAPPLYSPSPSPSPSPPTVDQGRRPSTPVFFFKQSPPLSAPPFRLSRVSTSQSDDSNSDFESPPAPPVLPERSYRRHLASSKNLSLSKSQELTSYLGSPPLLPERLHNRPPTTSSHNIFQPRAERQQRLQDRLPDVTSVPPRPTRGAFISTSSCPSPSSPSYTHSSRRVPLPPTPGASCDLPPRPPPRVPPRLAIPPPTCSLSDSSDI